MWLSLAFWTGFTFQGLSTKKPQQQHRQKIDRRHPPEPTNPVGTDFILAAELLFDEFIVVELVVGHAKPLRLGLVRPTGLLVGPAFWTGLGLRRNFRATIGTVLRSHPKLDYPIPAYSS